LRAARLKKHLPLRLPRPKLLRLLSRKPRLPTKPLPPMHPLRKLRPLRKHPKLTLPSKQAFKA
jgi:hypothetical protein